jgi:hypothetical protein
LQDEEGNTTSGHFVYMISAMAETFFTFICSFPDGTANPDIVEELLYLMGLMIDYFPVILLLVNKYNPYVIVLILLYK